MTNIRTKSIALGAAGGLALALLASPPTPAQAQLFSSEKTPAASQLSRAPLSFADIVERVKPAVVSINATNGGRVTTSQRSKPNQRGLQEFFPDLPEDHPLNEFFKNMPRNFNNAPTPRRAATGSGFVISADGYVVTNNHVIDGANQITVSFDQKEKLDAELVGTDPRTDLALLKIKTKRNFPFVKLTEKPARVGDWVLAVGNPFGLGGTVTAGIVSALARDIGSGPYDYLQIDAAVNRGNSGGPTFNLDGEVVGINTAIYSPSGGNVGIAFAVPAATAKRVIEELKTKGTVTRGWLGVKIRNVDKDTVQSLGLKDEKGALVAEVTDDGPAAKGGLNNFDVIKAINGKPIESSKDLSLKIAEFSPGTTVDITVFRGGREQTIKVMLGTFPTSSSQVAKLDGPKAPTKTVDSAALGLTLEPIASGAEKGLKITDIDSDGAAAKSGLSVGDLITHANQQPVNTVPEIEQIIKQAKANKRPKVMLGVRSKNQRRLVFVDIEKG
ncbi:MAG: putative periplasmic serine endoprotease DegP-like [Pseudomonadota bacterium]|jgi:serine protease Do